MERQWKERHSHVWNAPDRSIQLLEQPNDWAGYIALRSRYTLWGECSMNSDWDPLPSPQLDHVVSAVLMRETSITSGSVFYPAIPPVQSQRAQADDWPRKATFWSLPVSSAHFLRPGSDWDICRRHRRCPRSIQESSVLGVRNKWNILTVLRRLVSILLFVVFSWLPGSAFGPTIHNSELRSSTFSIGLRVNPL